MPKSSFVLVMFYSLMGQFAREKVDAGARALAVPFLREG